MTDGVMDSGSPTSGSPSKQDFLRWDFLIFTSFGDKNDNDNKNVDKDLIQTLASLALLIRSFSLRSAADLGIRRKSCNGFFSFAFNIFHSGSRHQGRSRHLTKSCRGNQHQMFSNRSQYDPLRGVWWSYCGCLKEVLLLELKEGSEGGVAKLTIPPGTSQETIKCKG